MTKEPEPIKVTPTTGLARLLELADTAPIVLERDGVRYRLAREDEDPWAGYDAARVRRALAKTAGSWADIDVEAAIAAVYRARAEGSRSGTRP